ESNAMESRKSWMLSIFRESASESKKHQKYKFWQNQYHPVELSSGELMDEKLDYIHDNPVKEGWVDSPEDYIYSSARDYCGVKGLLALEFIG
ncbi:MAG: hypothetical protein MUO54_01460, partial [Anaerolineales bacterium]|nr:hypothetical protein [Anaerolineales bacterium]